VSVIHDLGYARYAGERRSPATLWRVIMRQHLSYAWKTRWRFKPWIGLAVIITVIVGGFMYLQTNEMIRAIRQMGRSVRFVDAALPLAYEYYRIAAFMVSMTIGAAVIARDKESGAFTFYFSRPVRPLDYVLGKLAGQAILMALIFLAGPVALALFRIGLSADTDEAIEQLVILPKVLAIGGLATMVFAALPLAVSALAGRRTVALALWAAYYIAVVKLVAVVGSLTWAPLMAIDPGTSMSTIAVKLFDFEIGDELPPLWSAFASMLGQTVLAVWVVMTQVRKQAEDAVGASS
jgi:ABC-2 type transport system permease protein